MPLNRSRIQRPLRYIVKSLAVLALATAPWQHTAAQDNADDARRAAAERYLAATPITEMIGSATDEMAKQLPEKQRAQFRQVMLEEVDIERLEEITLNAMVETFTTAELNAFADFYGSDIGKSAMSKFGLYLAKVNPPLQREMMRALQAAQPHSPPSDH